MTPARSTATSLAPAAPPAASASGEHARRTSDDETTPAAARHAGTADPSHSLAVSRPDYYGNPAGVTDDLAVVRAIYAAFAARDLDAALAHVAPDAELVVVGTARQLERTEPYRGHAGVREYFADAGALWDELHIYAEDFRVVPGSVVVMGHVHARLRGQDMRRTVMWTWKLRDGLACSVRVSDLGERPAQ